LTTKRELLLGRIAAIAGAASLAVGLWAGVATASAASLTGAGSTLIAPLLEEHWKGEFEHRTGNTVTYSAVGSGAGIEQISARAVSFGASDAPLTSAQAAACHGCVQIPWALTATTVGFHIEGIRHLRLTGPVIAEIFLGKITNWDDPRIQKLNKRVHMPNLKITPVHRSDGSGDTYAFTNYLSDVSPQWKREVGYATSVNWKAGVGGKGNSGVTAIVVETNGSIGNISVAYLLEHHIEPAAIKNAAGKFEYPNLKNIEDAAKSVKRVPANNEMHIVDPPAKYRIAFPISTFTYCIIPKGTAQKSLLSQWVEYALTEGQKFGPALGFVKVPPAIVRAARRTLRSL
jgi:phosphate transport system substrate-binding protein